MGNLSRRAPTLLPLRPLDTSCGRLTLSRRHHRCVFPNRFSLALSVARGAYSYDWIHNGGSESPRALTPGLEHLAVGQDVMEIFQLAGFARDQHLTLRIKANSRAQRLFGDIAVSYLVVPKGPRICRLLVKLVIQHSPGVRGKLMRRLLHWGDLIMMRRQLLNFKQLAERRID